LRIDLSDGTFLNILPARTANGFCMMERKRDMLKKAEHLGGTKIPVADLSRTCVAMMLANGITAAEILAELFGQIHGVDSEQVEYLMRR